MHANATPVASAGTFRLGVGPEEEEVFRQLLCEHEFDESISMAAHAESMVDHLNGANLLEPIELPKNNSGGSVFDPSFKDIFLNMASPVVASPSGFGLHLYKAFTPTGQTPRGSFLDPHRTPRTGMYSENLMPVQPIGNSAIPVAPSQSMSAIQALQQAVWSNNPNGNALRLNPNSIKDVMRAATSTTAQRNATVPSPIGPITAALTPRSQSGFPHFPVWMSNSLLTPTGASQAAPDLTRNISSKKSKARKSSREATLKSKRSAAAFASLLGSAAVPPPIATRSVQAAVPKPALVSIPSSESQDSDEADSKLKGKKCVEEGCVRRAQSNSRCKAHGGGARCQYAGSGGCSRSSQGGGYCRAHGGGKRCEFPGCERGQQRKGRCYVHGGIRKCQTDGCEKKDRGNGFCISHGGGKRCVFPSCARSVRRGNLCQSHEDAGSMSSAS